MATHPKTLALVVVGVIAAATAGSGSAHQTVAKQRIAIEERFDVQTGTGTFVLYPLTPGPLKYDKGTITGYGGPKGAVFRTGMKVQLIVGGDDLTGKYGTIRLAQEIAHVEVRFGSGMFNDVGTWSLARGTGAYGGFKGGGRFAGVVLNSVVVSRQEGWVTG